MVYILRFLFILYCLEMLKICSRRAAEVQSSKNPKISAVSAALREILMGCCSDADFADKREKTKSL